MKQSLTTLLSRLRKSGRLTLRWLIMGVTDYRDATRDQFNADHGVDLNYAGYRVGPEHIPNPRDRRRPREPLPPQ